MAYTPTVWDCGDVVTAEKLNKIEEAIQLLSESGGSVLTVNIVGTDPALNQSGSETPQLRSGGVSAWLDKTWQQIYDAFPNVRVNLADPGSGTTSGFRIVSEITNDDLYGCSVQIGALTYATETTDGYPNR